VTAGARPAHPGDGALLALIDGEPGVEETRGHVAECGACAERLALLRRRVERLTQVLGETAPAVASAARLRPRPRPRARTWPTAIAAAAVFAVAGAGLAMVLHGRAMRSARVARVGTAAPRPAATASEGAPGTTAVSFVTADTVLDLRIDAAQSAGMLVIRATDAPRVSARIIGARGTEALLVLPSAVRVRNAPASTASYELLVPASVRRLRLEIAGRARRVDAAAELPLSLPLASQR
jgi:hypothetical protein